MKLDVPFFPQEEPHTCGPACLRMVLGHYGVELTEDEIARRCGATIIGTDRRGLVLAATYHGLAAQTADRMTREDLANQLRREAPVVAIVDPNKLYGRLPNFPHSIVVVGLDSGSVTYHDPARRPNMNVPWQRFTQAWDALRRKAVTVWRRPSSTE